MDSGWGCGCWDRLHLILQYFLIFKKGLQEFKYPEDGTPFG